MTCVAVHDRYVYTGAADATIIKWDIASCECVYVYKGHSSKIHKLLVTDDFVFSTSHDKTARLWYNDADKHPKAIIRYEKGMPHLPHSNKWI